MKSLPSLHKLQHRISHLTHDAWRTVRSTAGRFKIGRAPAHRNDDPGEDRGSWDWWRRRHH